MACKECKEAQEGLIEQTNSLYQALSKLQQGVQTLANRVADLEREITDVNQKAETALYQSNNARIIN